MLSGVHQLDSENDCLHSKIPCRYAVLCGFKVDYCSVYNKTEPNQEGIFKPSDSLIVTV